VLDEFIVTNKLLKKQVA